MMQFKSGSLQESIIYANMWNLAQCHCGSTVILHHTCSHKLRSITRMGFLAWSFLQYSNTSGSPVRRPLRRTNHRFFHACRANTETRPRVILCVLTMTVPFPTDHRLAKCFIFPFQPMCFKHSWCLCVHSAPAALPSLNTFHSQREEACDQKKCVSHNQNKSHIVWSRRLIRVNNQS